MGNNDKRADLKSPKKCIFQSSKLFGKSYRTKSSQCSPLSQQTVEEIRREEQECAKYETKRTQVSSIFSSGQRDSYSIKKHSYIYKKDQLCISQEPVVQCSEDSIPKSMKKKTIKFVSCPRAASASSTLTVSSAARVLRSSSISQWPSPPRWTSPSSVDLLSSKLLGIIF